MDTLLRLVKAEEILNKKSGWKALTGTTDFGKIAAHATMLSSSSESEDDFSASAHLAFNIFVDRITNYIGSYFVKLDGKVDALVFAGGIGEKSAILRKIIIEKTRCLGFEIDEGRNDDAGKMRDETGDIVVDVSAVLKRPGIEGKRVLVCWTDEQVSPLESFTRFTSPRSLFASLFSMQSTFGRGGIADRTCLLSVACVY